MLALLTRQSSDSEIRQALNVLQDKGLIGQRNRERIEDLITADRLADASEWVRDIQMKERT